MRSPRFSAVCLIVTSLAVAVSAAPAVADPAAARVHYERGRSYFQVSEYRKAIDEFKAAHVEKPDPAYLYNIAECYRLLGDGKEAVVFYRRFVTLAPASPVAGDAKKRIAEMEAGPVAAAPPPVTIAPVVPVKPIPPPAPPPDKPSQPPAVAQSAPAANPLPAAPVPAAAAPAPAAPMVVAVSAPSPAAEHKPFYKKAWFVAVVGAVVVAGALGVTWALTTKDGTDVPQTTLGNRGIFGQ